MFVYFFVAVPEWVLPTTHLKQPLLLSQASCVHISPFINVNRGDLASRIAHTCQSGFNLKCMFNSLSECDRDWI